MAGNVYGYTPSGNIHEEKVSNSKVLKRVLRQEKAYLHYVILSILLALITVLFTLLLPIRIGNAIDALIAGNYELMCTYLIYSACFAGIVAVSQYVMNLVNNKIVFHTVRDLRNMAFKRILKYPISLIDTKSQGDIASRVIADAEQFADGLLMGFTQLFTGVITILGTLAFMFSLNVVITLIVIIITPVSLLVAKFIASHTYDMFKVQSRQRGEQTALIDETLSNLKVVKAFGQEEKLLGKFDDINKELQKSSLNALFYSSLTNPSTRFVTNLVYALVACVGVIAVVNGGMPLFGGLTVGVLTCFLSYANQYMKPFNEISSVVTELQNSLVCAGRVFELIDYTEEESDGENALDLDVVSGQIKLDHIEFSYDKEKPLLKNLDLIVHSGMRVAIVGPTGCGKTTLINLLMRFYDVDQGTILLDGHDIRQLKLNSLRSSFGMVLQETWLFAGTIKENILFGKPDASEEEIIRAAKESHAHSFIRRLPQGYDTFISEDGGMLSQGQKQLLCITRLMLKNPPMLILDEATSSIDTRTEIEIQKAFHKLMDGKTTFIVAHRLSTIKNADLILVMKEGTVVEMGSHDELLKQNGFYSQLYSRV